MSLSDLKKKKTTERKRELSVEEFIEDAKAYAQGRSAITTESPKVSARKFKNATFTLSPENIQQLSELSQQSGIAKSKIIRLLIEYQSNLSVEELKQLEES